MDFVVSFSVLRPQSRLICRRHADDDIWTSSPDARPAVKWIGWPGKSSAESPLRHVDHERVTPRLLKRLTVCLT